MDPIKPEKRRVTNMKTGDYVTLYDDAGRADGEVLQVNPNKELGYGFHVYRMPPATPPRPTSTKATKNSWCWKAN